MAINQEYKEYRVLELPLSGNPGDRYYLNVGAGKYQTYIIGDDQSPFKEAGADFIEKDTMQAMRDLSDREIWALQNGFYKGVKLNGYYAEGDKPSVNYFLRETSQADNGGSIIALTANVTGFRLVSRFNDVVYIEDFGGKANDTSIDNALIFQTCWNDTNTRSRKSVSFLTSGDYTFKSRTYQYVQRGGISCLEGNGATIKPTYDIFSSGREVFFLDFQVTSEVLSANIYPTLIINNLNVNSGMTFQYNTATPDIYKNTVFHVRGGFREVNFSKVIIKNNQGYGILTKNIASLNVSDVVMDRVGGKYTLTTGFNDFDSFGDGIICVFGNSATFTPPLPPESTAFEFYRPIVNIKNTQILSPYHYNRVSTEFLSRCGIVSEGFGAPSNLIATFNVSNVVLAGYDRPVHIETVKTDIKFDNTTWDVNNGIVNIAGGRNSTVQISNSRVQNSTLNSQVANNPSTLIGGCFGEFSTSNSNCHIDIVNSYVSMGKPDSFIRVGTGEFKVSNSTLDYAGDRRMSYNNDSQAGTFIHTGCTIKGLPHQQSFWAQSTSNCKMIFSACTIVGAETANANSNTLPNRVGKYVTISGNQDWRFDDCTFIDAGFKIEQSASNTFAARVFRMKGCKIIRRARGTNARMNGSSVDEAIFSFVQTMAIYFDSCDFLRMSKSGEGAAANSMDAIYAGANSGTATGNGISYNRCTALYLVSGQTVSSAAEVDSGIVNA